jgi:hypothetical protein
VRTLSQYNSLARQFSTSVRYNFIYRPGSDLYVVYNDLQQTGLTSSALTPSVWLANACPPFAARNTPPAYW